MTTLFRFAPSPTGYLHVGNARIAVLNYIFAKSLGGEFMLRMDDTDEARNQAIYDEAIKTDLSWLGIDWDRFERQSLRLAQYQAARDKLIKDGRLYPCFESAEELALKRKTQLNRGLPPIYDRAALTLETAEIEEKINQGEKPHWRFKLTGEEIAFKDLARGEVHFGAGHLSDPVLIREDGRVLYTLSSVVDDGEMAVTHILRGEDHVTNTAAQVELFQALGYHVPNFIHLPLMLGSQGEKLSKRIGGLTLQELRDEGFEPGAIFAQLTKLGSNETASGQESLDDLIANFDIRAFGRAAPRFDKHQLVQMNRHRLAAYAYHDVKNKVEGWGVSATLWQAICGNLDRLEDAKSWVAICYGDFLPPLPNEEDKDYLALAATALPQEEAWQKQKTHQGIYDDWIANIKAKSPRKGKGLFMPLRLALTGRQYGPQMQEILPLIGHQRVMQRLQAHL